MINKVIVGGNLTGDVETRSNKNGNFQTFAIAHNYGKGDKQITTFIGCLAGGKVGENIAKYFSKGKPILVEGSLRQGKLSLYLNVDVFHFLPNTTKQESAQVDKPPSTNEDELPF